MIVYKEMNFSKYTKYTKTIGQYFGASLIPMLVSLAINPLVAMNMSPEDYAVVGYYSSFSTLLSPLIMFYMLHYYTKCYFEVDDEGRKRLRAMLVQSLIWFSGLITLCCLIVLFGYISIFNKDSSIPFYPYALLSIGALPITGVYSLMLTDLRMSRASGRYLNISLTACFLTTSLTLLFVVVYKYGAFGKLLAPLIANIVFFIYACFYYRDSFKISYDKQSFMDMVKFCLPLTIAAMLGFFSNGYDRVFLERLGNNTELGYYSVGVSMAAYISVFQSAIGNTFQPDLFQAIAQRNRKQLAKVVVVLVGSTACIVAVFIVAAPLVVKILTAGRYMMSVKYTQIVALSTLTSAMYYTVSQITIALGKSKITLATKIITTLVSVMMFSVLINHYSYMGAAWGLVLSFLVSLVINLLLLYLHTKTKNSLCR